ncbi:MAG TPA: TlpA disulfide reductase family protein [Pyrinomonadaceae bacterium]|nr:TlpA disulfide reductase family protein [Pyrinomonadaceae bacterium]
MSITKFLLTFDGRTALALLIALFSVALFRTEAVADDVEYLGRFETTLTANTEERERIVFKPAARDRVKEAGTFDEGAHFTTALLFDPMTGKQTILALLVEEEDKDPVLFIDQNDDKKIVASEKYELKAPQNPYLWETNVTVPVKGSFFTAMTIHIQFFQSIQMDKMTEDDRLLRQTTGVLARGVVDVNGKKVAVQYALPTGQKKVNSREGWLGMDADGDGLVDMDNLSPEAAKANNEAVIFRVGDIYLSTKKADLEKNQIVLRGHEAKEYKRLELAVGKEFPEFTFSDFDGKKRKFSDFRGTYVLLDIWGFWCPPCRKELPYIREAHRRFGGRNLQIIGLNTDPDFTIDSMKKALKDNGMIWTQAKFDTVVDFLRVGLRVSAFPTTFLISPEGKILSMSRHERNELDLRGEDLLTSLDKTLPR